MKFGDTFHQRSVPDWSTHNVDYNDLKVLIKRRTTRNKGNGEAQTIPGAQNEARASERFEDELYIQLKDQHARVDLFVRSKAGEYTRKLAHLRRQITNLEQQTFSLGQTTISVRRLEKFSKLEDQTLRAGSEIQSLVQFANANRLALQKLLKKYKKWTGSPGLGQRFRKDVLSSSSNLNSNFEPLVEQYVDALASVRRPFDTGANWRLESSTDKRVLSKAVQVETAPSNVGRRALDSSAGILYTANQKGSRIELDAALATTPLGPQASRTAYWVHPDNVVQLQILLLQYSRIRNWNGLSNSSKSNTGSRTSPRVSVNGQANDCLNTGGHEFGLIICDDLDQFVTQQRSQPIDGSETSTGSTLQKSAATIRYSSEKDSLLAVTVSSRRPDNRLQRSFHTTRFRKKTVRHPIESSSDEECAVFDSPDDSHQYHSWIADHPDVRPLAQIQYKRSHFIGIRNLETSGIWATLDTEVDMRKSSKDSMLGKKEDVLLISGGEKSELQRFPLAILEVRIEGTDASHLVAALDASHLATRIRGFSLETHAIATLYKPEGMSSSLWLPRLEEDMRKLPSSTIGVNGRNQHKSSSPEQANTRHTSISASSTLNGQSGGAFSPAQGESSATSVPEQLVNPALSNFKKKKTKRPKRRRLPAKELKGPPLEQRYWNEFDDGSEGERDEPFTVFVDPNPPEVFPGAAAFSEAMKSNSKAAWQKIQTWLTPKAEHDTAPNEQSPLLNDCTSPTSPTIEDSSDSDAESSKIVKHRGYSTIPSRHRHNNHHHHHNHYGRSARESILFRITLSSFLTALVFVVVAAILVGTGRKKATVEVNVGVVICVAASLVSAVVGTGCTIARRDALNWVHRCVVGLALLLVLLGNGGVLVGLGHEG